MARKRIYCGSCNSFVRPVPIAYGYPLPETEERARRGELVLGGCILEPDAPRFACPQCRASIELDELAIPNRLDGDGGEERIHRMFAAIGTERDV